MQPIRHIPIEALPGASFIVQRQPKQRQDRIIDLVRVDLHPPSLAQIARLPRPRPDGYSVHGCCRREICRLAWRQCLRGGKVAPHCGLNNKRIQYCAIAAAGATDIRIADGVYRSINAGATNPAAVSINASAVNVVQGDNLVSAGITVAFPQSDAVFPY
jgi:hypothetical protein